MPNAIAIGGTSANENLESTPLADDDHLYVVDQWSVVYKIDVFPGRRIGSLKFARDHTRLIFSPASVRF